MQYNHFGHLIKAMRQLKGLTQRELAEDICSVKQLSRIENGESITNLLFLYQFSNRLGENLADFLMIFRCEEPLYILNRFKELEENYFKLDFKALLDITNQMIEDGKKDLELPEINQLIGWYRGVAMSNLGIEVIEEDYYLSLLKLSTKKCVDDLCHSYLSQTELRLVHSIIAVNCRQGNFEQAILRLTRLRNHLENNYFNYNHKILHELYFNLSKVYLTLGKNELAAETASKGIEVSKKNHDLATLPDFYHLLGRAYENLGLEEEAVKQFNWFINLYRMIGHNQYSLDCETELKEKYGDKLNII